MEFDERTLINDAFGIITGTYAQSQFPDVPCSIALLKARSSNTGSFFIGGNGKTVFELDAGQDTGWFDISNLNLLYHAQSSGTSDKLAYWIKR